MTLIIYLGGGRDSACEKRPCQRLRENAMRSLIFTVISAGALLCVNSGVVLAQGTPPNPGPAPNSGPTPSAAPMPNSGPTPSPGPTPTTGLTPGPVPSSQSSSEAAPRAYPEPIRARQASDSQTVALCVLAWIRPGGMWQDGRDPEAGTAASTELSLTRSLSSFQQVRSRIITGSLARVPAA
jgi:hypothetical protein